MWTEEGHCNLRAAVNQCVPAVQVVGLNADMLTAKADMVSESTYSASPGKKTFDQEETTQRTIMKSQKPAQKSAGKSAHRESTYPTTSSQTRYI